MGGRTLALTVFGAVALGAPLASQQAPPTFRSAADLVRLHVVVRDEQGRPVHGLTKDDFALLDSKQPRAIEIFEEVGPRTEPRPKPIVPAHFPLDVADNRVAKASRLVVIVLDDMVTRPYHEKTKSLAREAVSRLGVDALIALVTTSGMDGVEATVDHSAILRAIDRLGTPASRAPRIPQRFGSDVSHATLAEKLLVRGDGNGCHLTVLGQAARMVLGPEATRRVFLYVGPYCGVDFFALMTPDDPYFYRYREMTEWLRQANVAFYAMDPRGEMGFGLAQFPAEDIVSGNSPPSRYSGSTRSSSPVMASQKALRDLAATTGGLAITNSNAFDKGFEQIEDDLSHYYVLAFHSGDPKPNRYHAVDVKVNRPGLILRFRPGYYSGRMPIKEDKDPMVRLAAGAIPAPDLPLRLFAVSEPRGGRSRVNLVLEVGWTGLEKPNATGRFDEFLDGMVLVAKVMSGKLERKWAVKRPVMVPVPASSPGFAAYQVVTQVDLPPGSYQFRVSAKSRTGRTGSVFLAAEIPQASGMTLGDILVGAVDRVPPVVVSSPANVTPMPFVITLDRVFIRTERLRLFAKIFRLQGSAAPAAKLDFVDAAGTVVKSLDAPLSAGAQAIDTPVDLSGLAPGAYLARLAINAGASTASRHVSIVVK